MKLKNYKDKNKIYIIAEIGNNHEGNFETAKRLIIAAAKTGVDAVKFQIYKTNKYVSINDNTRFNQLKKFELNEYQFERLSEIAYKNNLAFIATPFDLKSAELTGKICDAIKVSSSDNGFFPLVEKVSQLNKPIFMSTGLYNIDYITKSYEILENSIGITNFALFHCVTAYPVPINEANINAIKSLIKKFDCHIGYSDHTIGKTACIAAASLGANIIEKHFTLDNNYSDFRDHKMSANPSQMTSLVKNLRILEKLLGSGVMRPSKSEINSDALLRRSIISNKYMPKGYVIKKDDLDWVRPSGGMKPGRENELINHITTREISKGSILSPRDVIDI